MKKYVYIFGIITCIITIFLISFLYKKYNKQEQLKTNNVINNSVQTQDNTILEENTIQDSNNENEIVIDNNTSNNQETSKTVIETIQKESSTSKPKTNNNYVNNSTNNSHVKNEVKVQSNQESVTYSEEPKQEIKQETKEEVKQEETKENPITINLDKYDRYEKTVGGYKGFKRNDAEIEKLRNLINEAIQEFGYANVTLQVDSSITNTRYFTANKTNVENLVYNSEYFTICYYAETEYLINEDGTESVLQVRSYGKVK